MKKIKQSIIANAMLILALGCAKNPVAPPAEEPREPAEIINNIVGNLAAADSISVFVEGLKALSLSATDVETGITVFAPLNAEEAIVQQALMMDKKPVIQAFGSEDLTPTVIKDHIVKGVIKLTDLTNEQILTSLSGKELKISRVGDKVWINGIQIGSEEIGATLDQVVYTVKELLSGTTIDDVLQTTSLEVVVWNAVAWTPESEKGALAPGATVRLYRSQADFANEIVAYESETGTAGKAVFADIDPGTYFVGVEFGDKGNIFYATLQDGVYRGMASAGIFQSEQAIRAAPGQHDANLGNFQWIDTNADDTITTADMVPLPYESAEANDGRIKTIEVLIGYDDNSAHKPLTQQAFQQQLNSVHDWLGGWQKDMAVLDALLGGEVMADTLHSALANQFRWTNDFSFGPATPMIHQLWQGGYYIIRSLNDIESRAPQSAELGSLRLFRAYAYLQLMHYFGNIPLVAIENRGENLSNSDPDAVYAFIVSELEQAVTQLPQQVADGGVSKGTAQALLAKAALFKRDYPTVVTLTEQIIASGVYSLSSTAQIFQPGGSEIIWDHSGTLTSAIKQFFHGRNVFPVIRYTEVMLMNAEALVATGKAIEAGQICNQLAGRRGLPLPIAPGGAVMADELQGIWMREMLKEGSRFVSLVRWGKAAGALGWKGYTEGKNNVLPIPQAVMDANLNMSQNPNY